MYSKILIIKFILLITIGFCLIQTMEATPLYTPAHEKTTFSTNEKPAPIDFKNLSKKDLERKLGRKLRFKEKVALFLVKRKMKNWKKFTYNFWATLLFFISGIIIGSVLNSFLVLILVPVFLGAITAIITKKSIYFRSGLLGSPIIFGAILIFIFLIWTPIAIIKYYS